MTITIIGLVSVMATVLGLSWKLYKHIREVEVHITNHMQHQMERMEEKIDKVDGKVDKVLEKLHEHMINGTSNHSK